MNAKVKGTRKMVVLKWTRGLIIAALTAASVLTWGIQAVQAAGIKNVVLVHGAFADGSGWQAVAKILERDGYTVSVAQPPETSYADDQEIHKGSH